MDLRTLLPALALTLLAATGCAQETSTADDPAPTASESPSETPSETATSSATASPDAVPLQDLPLTQGWPSAQELGSDGRIIGPRRGMDPIELAACEVTVRFDVAERVDARLDSPEDFRYRAVGTYPDESEANAAAANLVQPFRDCRSEPQDALTRIHRVSGEPTDPGGAQISTSFEMEGSPAIGVQSIVVVQRGLTLVVSLWSTEGMGQQRATEMARTDADQLQPLLAELPSP